MKGIRGHGRAQDQAALSGSLAGAEAKADCRGSQGSRGGWQGVEGGTTPPEAAAGSGAGNWTRKEAILKASVSPSEELE